MTTDHPVPHVWPEDGALNSYRDASPSNTLADVGRDPSSPEGHPSLSGLEEKRAQERALDVNKDLGATIPITRMANSTVFISTSKEKETMTAFFSLESRDTCMPLTVEPHATVQVVTPGKNASDMFSTGVVLSITCAEGYRLNVGNRTVRCKRGVWKPERPACLLSKTKLFQIRFDRDQFFFSFFLQFRAPFRISRTRLSSSTIQPCYQPTRKFRTMKRHCLVVIRDSSFKDRKSIAVGLASLSIHADRHLNAFLGLVNCPESLTENTRLVTALD